MKKTKKTTWKHRAAAKLLTGQVEQNGPDVYYLKGQIYGAYDHLRAVCNLFATCERFDRSMPARKWPPMLESLLQAAVYAERARIHIESRNKSRMSYGEALAEIEAVCHEYEACYKDGTLTLTTTPVVLEGEDGKEYALGEMEIGIHLKTMVYRVQAKKPQYSAEERLFHPHVNREGEVCTGDARTAIAAAQRDGRLLDMVILLNNLLHTYNPDSPFVRLVDWEGGEECSDCGARLCEDESYCCYSCGDLYCESCSSYCASCGYNYCAYCSDGQDGGCCSVCGSWRCGNCVHRCIDCGSELCGDHCATCDSCGESVCEDCGTVNEDGETLCERCHEYLNKKGSNDEEQNEKAA